MSGFVLPTPMPAVADGNGNGNNGHGHGVATLPTIGGEVVDAEEVTAEVERMTATEAIAWAVERFHPDLRFAVSFQKTSSVVVDMAHRIEPGARYFYVDTGLLFPETYETRDRLGGRYGVEFERIADGPVAAQASERAANLWRLDPDACCADRKVELMRTALDQASCWVSGIRRVDSDTRADAPRFGWDQRFGLWKLNPLADWDEKQVWNYIKEHHVPYNPLHDQGYPSIGCMPCTTVALEGAGERAGRWAGTDRTECGIHG
jgi:phosphoadenosine phosphosulfate reductase